MSNSLLISSALLLTNEKLFSAVDGGNSWLAAITKRGARVKLYREYCEGSHRASLTSQMKKMLRLETSEADLESMNANFCGIVLDKFAGRISVAEISIDDEAAEKSWLEPLLTKQDFQASEGTWWRGAIGDGDSFVMVDPVTLLWVSEPAFDGFAGMVAIYNQMTRKPVWACKLWSESDPTDRDEDEGGTQKTMRLVVYQPDKISWWQGEEGGQEVEPMPQENGETERVWPAELKGALPFVSFSNDRNNYTNYGNSEIRKAIPLNDVLNRTVYSMVMASEFTAFGMNWSKGMEIDPGGMVPGAIINLVLKNSAGVAITDFTPEQISFLQACAVGQFPPTNIVQYTNQIDKIVEQICYTTQTPIYGITGSGAISGDALKQLEIGLIGKVVRFQRQNKDALKELIVLTANMERLFAPGMGTPEIKTVHVTWKSPELLDANVQIAALTQMRKDADGLWADRFYQQKIGQLMGMSKTDITDEIAAAGQEKKDKLKAMVDLQPPSMFGRTPADNQTGVEAPATQPTPKTNNAKPMMATK